MIETDSSGVIGTLGQGLISYENPSSTETQINFADIVSASRRDLTRKAVTRRKSLLVSSKRECIHASLQYLDKVSSSEKDNKYASNLQLNANNGLQQSYRNNGRFALLALVWQEAIEKAVYYSASVCLLVEKVGKSCTTGESNEDTGRMELRKVSELMLVNKYESKFHAHLLPPHKRPDEESDADTSEETKVSSFKNRVVVLNLDESKRIQIHFCCSVNYSNLFEASPLCVISLLKM